MKKPSIEVAMLYLNIVQFVIWTVLIAPTMLWWRNSITWISFMSIYAIWISCLTAIMASLSAKTSKENPPSE